MKRYAPQRLINISNIMAAQVLDYAFSLIVFGHLFCFTQVRRYYAFCSPHP